MTNSIQNILNNSHQLIQEGLFKESFHHTVEKLDELTSRLSQETIDTTVREACLQHPVSKFFMQDPITKWSFQKPRGYAGDAVLIDYLYRIKSCDHTDTYIGRELYGLVTETPAVKALRWRSYHMASEIEKFQKKANRKIDVISVASGHLRELSYISNPEEKLNRYVCIDQDLESNQLVRSTNSQHSFLEVIDDSIAYILKGKLKDQQFDFIYSAGLFDYLNDKLASKMIERLYANLRPGGVLYVPNFMKDIPEKAYMDTFMKWNLIYRDATEMSVLCSGLDIPSHNQEIYEDEFKRIVYLKISK